MHSHEDATVPPPTPAVAPIPALPYKPPTPPDLAPASYSMLGLAAIGVALVAPVAMGVIALVGATGFLRPNIILRAGALITVGVGPLVAAVMAVTDLGRPRRRRWPAILALVLSVGLYLFYAVLLNGGF